MRNASTLRQMTLKPSNPLAIAEAPEQPVVSSANSKTKLWFQTQPIDKLTKYGAFQLETQSTYPITPDEAICSFQLVLLRKDKVVAFYYSHANDAPLSGQTTKQFGRLFDQRHEVFSAFQPEDAVGVQINASFPGWKLRSIHGRLLVKSSADIPPGFLQPNLWSLNVIPEGGLYTIVTTAESKVSGRDGASAKKIWFKTPIFDRHIISRIEAVKLYTTARYEIARGAVDNVAKKNSDSASFEVVILDNPGTETPKTDGVRESHEVTTDFYTELQGPALVRSFGVLSNLMPGNVIAVRTCASGQWTNHATNGRLVIQLSAITPTIHSLAKASSTCIENTAPSLIWLRTSAIPSPLIYSAFQLSTHPTYIPMPRESLCKFYLVILGKDNPDMPAVRDKKELAWYSHSNEMSFGCDSGLKQFGMVFDHKHEIFSYIKPGDILALQIRMPSSGWHLRCIGGEIRGRLRTGAEEYQTNQSLVFGLDPILEDGLYSIICISSRSVYADSHSGSISAIWFQSPLFDKKTRHHIHSVKVYLQTIKKEYLPNSEQLIKPDAPDLEGCLCSSEIGILDSKSSWASYRGTLQKGSTSQMEEEITFFGSDSPLLNDLKVESALAVRISAEKGWSIKGLHGRFVLRIQGVCCCEELPAPSPTLVPEAAKPIEPDSPSESKYALAAVMFPDIPNAPKIYSKYIIQALYQPSPDDFSEVLTLLVNSDVAVPRFQSSGVTDDPSTSAYSLKVEFQDIIDATGFAQFWGSIGKGELHLTTNKKVIIHGPIDGGPDESLAFVGAGTWLKS